MEVLRAAAHVFSEQGFRQATLEGVASSLGMTRPALYHYARSKDALLSECDAIAREQLQVALNEALRETTGLARLRTFFRHYTETIADEFGRCFLLTAQSEMTEAQRASTRLFQWQMAVAITTMIELGIADGTIRDCSAADASRAMFGAFNGIVRWRGHPDGRTSQEIADVFLDIFVKGLGGSPQAAPPI